MVKSKHLKSNIIGAIPVGIDKPHAENSGPLLKRVIQSIADHHMLDSGDKLLVGVSGGADSVALLHLLIAIRPIYKLKLAVAHLNHGLRKSAADQDAKFVENLAQHLSLHCHCEKIELDQQRGSLEERARCERYAYYDRLMTAHSYTKLALGHQAGDNAEAVLMHLLRGSGIRGLSGIPPRRDYIVRPLIDVPRKDIVNYLKSMKISYVEDASNTDLRFQRNRIRHHLLPMLEARYNPKIVDTLNRTATLCRDEQGWLNNLMRPYLEEAVARSDPAILELKADSLLCLPKAAQRRLIRMGLRSWMGNIRRVGLEHIDGVLELLNRPAAGNRLSLPQRLVVERTAHCLKFQNVSLTSQVELQSAIGYRYPVPLPLDEVLTINISEANRCLSVSIVAPDHARQEMSQTNHIAWFDADRLEFPLMVRNFKPGDRLAPLGMQGSQKVKKLFIDRKIPRKQRMTIPILVQGDLILWIAGLRRAAAAPIVQDTKRVLRIEIIQCDHASE